MNDPQDMSDIVERLRQLNLKDADLGADENERLRQELAVEKAKGHMVGPITISDHRMIDAQRIAELEAALATARSALECIEKWEFDWRGDCVAEAKAVARRALAQKEGG